MERERIMTMPLSQEDYRHCAVCRKLTYLVLRQILGMGKRFSVCERCAARIDRWQSIEVCYNVLLKVVAGVLVYPQDASGGGSIKIRQ